MAEKPVNEWKSEALHNLKEFEKFERSCGNVSLANKANNLRKNYLSLYPESLVCHNPFGLKEMAGRTINNNIDGCKKTGINSLPIPYLMKMYLMKMI